MKHVAALTLLCAIAGCSHGPRRQFGFINASKQTLNIVFEKGGANGDYVVDQTLPPHTTAYRPVPVGHYRVIVFDEQGHEVRTVLEDYDVQPESAREKAGTTWIDLAGEGADFLVDASFVYQAGNGLAQAIADQRKGGQIVRARFDADRPFWTPPLTAAAFTALPQKIGALDSALILVHCSAEQEKAGLADCIEADLAARPAD